MTHDSDNMTQNHNNFFDNLKIKIHQFILLTYNLTDKFPRSELYGTTSQIRRAAISIMLNFQEGFARFKPKVKLNFFETSYGSIKECKYLIYFALEKKWINQEEYDHAFGLVDDIGKMFWGIIDGLSKQVKDE